MSPPTSQKDAASSSHKGDYDAVRKDIAAILDQPGYDDGSAGPILVRCVDLQFSPSLR